jgi:glycosyltransferase involved in cell wall biosynthesis
MRTELPLISCICVTYKKTHLLDRAIKCFEAQTYPNKQLIILYEDIDTETKFFTANHKFSGNCKIIGVDGVPKRTLGELRNIAIDSADGEFICQWDDDDWYHINRLEYQFNVTRLSGKCGSLLRHWLIFDSTQQKLYISHARNWEGSILCEKRLFRLKTYDNCSKGEDTGVVEYLIDCGCLTARHDAPGLYMYVYHGRNTWDLNHFNEIFKCSQVIDTEGLDISQVVTLAPAEASCIIDELLYQHQIKHEEKADVSMLTS